MSLQKLQNIEKNTYTYTDKIYYYTTCTRLKRKREVILFLLLAQGVVAGWFPSFGLKHSETNHLVFYYNISHENVST